jgi:hypothetical protein
MPDSPASWVGMVGQAATFLVPLLPDWLFEGPRTSKHWLRRHICDDCGVPWTDGHTCTPGRARPARSFVASCAGFSGPLGARAAIDPGVLGAVSRPGGLSAHSAKPNDRYHSPLWALMCEAVSRAGGAARELAGDPGEAS